MAAVEFALLLIPLLVIIWGMISYGIMFTYRQALSQAAGEGARAAVAAPSTSTWTAASAAVNNALGSYSQACGTSSGTQSTSYLTCTVSAAATCANDASHTCVTVTLTYPYRTNPLIPNIPGLGIIVPSTLTFVSTVEVS
ncbi:hypothetical protein Back2_25070 [Nocardioides baekrokdamisoli]|uniref:TadE-like domain-containing protein n=1 Tax=Nocardioides baekrokdamisoli TaxID=1804624 RepID=A0A3G9IGN4_9ACTN|nr:TadE/TadG family type IV pilus assembly protein [Nocardioides baekrokdamisoli]BBH18220.1 hypothetical protein Back2_25070 [Nocardioides baekrokdamisoli]